MIVTIDGPTASGKSTMGRLLADHFGFQYLNSGALYRALAYLLMEKKGYSLESLKNPSLEDIKLFLSYDRLRYVYCPEGERVFFDGIDIWPVLKSSIMDQASSVVSADPNVREELLAYQHHFARHNNVIVDGRDCGSVVFPHAQVKFFLQAGVKQRAARWQQVQQERGVNFAIAQATQKITERDERDSHREVAPLVIPQGAIVVDNSTVTIEQTLEFMISIIDTFGALKKG